MSGHHRRSYCVNIPHPCGGRVDLLSVTESGKQFQSHAETLRLPHTHTKAHTYICMAWGFAEGIWCLQRCVWYQLLHSHHLTYKPITLSLSSGGFILCALFDVRRTASRLKKKKSTQLPPASTGGPSQLFYFKRLTSFHSLSLFICSQHSPYLFSFSVSFTGSFFSSSRFSLLCLGCGSVCVHVVLHVLIICGLFRVVFIYVSTCLCLCALYIYTCIYMCVCVSPAVKISGLHHLCRSLKGRKSLPH